MTTTTCPGCVGRGTGTHCCMCDGEIPAHLRRTAQSPSEVQQSCHGCRTGTAHTHQATPTP